MRPHPRCPQLSIGINDECGGQHDQARHAEHRRGILLQAGECHPQFPGLLRQVLAGRAVEVHAEHGDIRYAGFVDDAAKEYAEARLTYALALGRELPLPAELGVGVPPYLNGLGEAVGELRRRMLDLLRAERMEEAEATLDAMEAIQGLLASLDYPDGMTGGLRRTTDVARALIERSRADLTSTIVQERLRRDLAERLGDSPPAG